MPVYSKKHCGGEQFLKQYYHDLKKGLSASEGHGKGFGSIVSLLRKLDP